MKEQQVKAIIKAWGFKSSKVTTKSATIHDDQNLPIKEITFTTQEDLIAQLDRLDKIGQLGNH